jgi:cytochrome c oxidase assembly protein subunit 11
MHVKYIIIWYQIILVYDYLLYIGIYFNKIQCFCFEEQRLGSGEELDLPVFFYIDPEFASDPNMDNVHDITLSYTFFKTGEEAPVKRPVKAVSPSSI